MCGIAGILKKNKGIELEREIKRMTELISHRGPDGVGFFVEKDIAFGHRRLSIIDLSSLGSQPMKDRDGLEIVYNGEIYNYLELKEELVKKGHIFISKTDTEVILKAYKEWGSNCLKRFNGMFAFSIWDKKKEEFFCARDRFGEKPFYYFSSNNVFAFSSEIKPLIDFTEKKPNEELIYDFLRFGILDHTNETFFSGIKKLPPASFMKVSKKGEIKIERYWDFFVSEDIFSNEKEEKKNTEEFLELFIDAVRIRLRSDVPVGSCLSGGLDSSSIVCIMNDLLKNKENNFIIETFSSCFNELSFDERKYIEEVIKKTKTNKNYIFPSPDDFMKKIDNILFHQEEPFAGSGVYSHNKIMEKIKDDGKVKVLLDGQGADEILLGYRKFYLFYIKNLLEKKYYIKFLIEFIKFFFSFEILKTLDIKKGMRYFKIGRKIQNIDFLLNESFLKEIGDREINFGYKKNISERIKEDTTTYSIPILLRYGDKNSMMYGIESRLPFLDYRLVEKVSSLSMEEKINNGWTKFILRNAMKGIIPEKIRKRKSKLGFSTPEEKWFREEMRSNIEETLKKSDFINRYINKKNLLKELNKFFNKKSLLGEDVFFRFYILEKWGKMFF